MSAPLPILYIPPSVGEASSSPQDFHVGRDCYVTRNLFVGGIINGGGGGGGSIVTTTTLNNGTLPAEFTTLTVTGTSNLIGNTTVTDISYLNGGAQISGNPNIITQPFAVLIGGTGTQAAFLQGLDGSENPNTLTLNPSGGSVSFPSNTILNSSGNVINLPGAAGTLALNPASGSYVTTVTLNNNTLPASFTTLQVSGVSSFPTGAINAGDLIFAKGSLPGTSSAFNSLCIGGDTTNPSFVQAFNASGLPGTMLLNPGGGSVFTGATLNVNGSVLTGGNSVALQLPTASGTIALNPASGSYVTTVTMNNATLPASFTTLASSGTATLAGLQVNNNIITLNDSGTGSNFGGGYNITASNITTGSFLVGTFMQTTSTAVGNVGQVFYFYNASADLNNNFLGLTANSLTTNVVKLFPSGKFTTPNVTLDDGNGNVAIVSTNGGGASTTPISVLYSALATGSGIFMQIGKALSTNNAAGFGFTSNATAANSTASLFVAGAPGLTINGLGNVAMPGLLTLSSAASTNTLLTVNNTTASTSGTPVILANFSSPGNSGTSLTEVLIHTSNFGLVIQGGLIQGTGPIIQFATLSGGTVQSPWLTTNGSNTPAPNFPFGLSTSGTFSETISSTASTALASFFQPNLVNAGFNDVQIGVSATNSNTAVFGFSYVSSGSLSNSVSLGTRGNAAVTIDGNGNIVIPGTTSIGTTVVTGGNAVALQLPNSAGRIALQSGTIVASLTTGTSPVPMTLVAASSGFTISGGNSIVLPVGTFDAWVSITGQVTASSTATIQFQGGGGFTFNGPFEGFAQNNLGSLQTMTFGFYTNFTNSVASNAIQLATTNLAGSGSGTVRIVVTLT